MTDHIAIYERSNRLQKIISYFQRCAARSFMPSTRDIIIATGVCGIPQAIGALKDPLNGFLIECFYSHRTENGNRVWVYRIKGRRPDRVWQAARRAAGIMVKA